MGRQSSVAAVIFLLAVCTAQETTFRSDVKLVRVLATVRDETGALVAGLDKDDFEITDNGAKQKIAVFERQTAQPLAVTLMVDISASTAKDMPLEIQSLHRFIDELFREGNTGDLASLYSFNDDVSLLANFTRDKARLKTALHRMKPEAGTSLYDALVLAAPSLADRAGRRVMLVVTDGGDTTSKYTYQQALRKAIESEIAIYSILIQPIKNDAGRNMGGENALYSLAASTGGRVFLASVGPRLNDAFSGVLRALRSQYYLGFYPANVPLSKNPFHKLELRLTHPGLHAEARNGYYGDTLTDARPGAAKP